MPTCITYHHQRLPAAIIRGSAQHSWGKAPSGISNGSFDNYFPPEKHIAFVRLLAPFHCQCRADKKKKKKLESTNYPPLTHGCAINQTQSERDPARERETRREDSCRLPRSLPVCPWGTGKLSRGRAKKQCSALSTLSYLQTPLCAGDWQRLCFPQPFRCGTSNMAHNMKGHIEQQSGVLRLLNPSPEDQCEMEPLHTTLIDDGPIK